MTQYCRRCGATLNGTEKFCPECGLPTGFTPEMPYQKQHTPQTPLRGEQGPGQTYYHYRNEPTTDPRHSVPLRFSDPGQDSIEPYGDNDNDNGDSGRGMVWLWVILATVVIGAGLALYLYTAKEADISRQQMEEQARLDSLHAIEVVEEAKRDSVRRDSVAYAEFVDDLVNPSDIPGMTYSSRGVIDTDALRRRLSLHDYRIVSHTSRPVDPSSADSPTYSEYFYQREALGHKFTADVVVGFRSITLRYNFQGGYDRFIEGLTRQGFERRGDTYAIRDDEGNISSTAHPGEVGVATVSDYNRSITIRTRGAVGEPQTSTVDNAGEAEVSVESYGD